MSCQLYFFKSLSAKLVFKKYKCLQENGCAVVSLSHFFLPWKHNIGNRVDLYSLNYLVIALFNCLLSGNRWVLVFAVIAGNNYSGFNSKE